MLFPAAEDICHFSLQLFWLYSTIFFCNELIRTAAGVKVGNGGIMMFSGLVLATIIIIPNIPFVFLTAAEV